MLAVWASFALEILEDNNVNLNVTNLLPSYLAKQYTAKELTSAVFLGKIAQCSDSTRRE